MDKRRKMDDSFIDEEIRDYRNCIVTTRDDDDFDSGEETLESNNEQPDLPKHTFNGANTSRFAKKASDKTIDYAQFATAKLKPYDLFVFVLGMLTRIEDFLENFDEGNDKMWLQTQTAILKSVMIANCGLLNVEKVVEINGVLYIKDKETKKKQVSKPNKEPLSTFIDKEVKTSKEMEKEVLPEITECTISNGHTDDKSNEVDGQVPSNNQNSAPLLNRRHSERLEKLKGAEVILCDKLMYTALKFPSFSLTYQPTNLPTGRIMKKKLRRKQNYTIKAGKKGVAKSVPPLSKSSVNKIPKAATRSKNMANTSGRNLQNQESVQGSAGQSKMELNNIEEAQTNTNSGSSPPKLQKQTNRNKRRAASEVREGTKKAKINEQKAKSFVCVSSGRKSDVNSSTSSSNKRRSLYSPDTWLHSLSTYLSEK